MYIINYMEKYNTSPSRRCISYTSYIKEQLAGLGSKSLVSESSNITSSGLVRDSEESNGVLSDPLSRVSEESLPG